MPEHTLASHQPGHRAESRLRGARSGRDEGWRADACLHDDTLERTTNIAAVFPDRPSANVPTRAPGKHWLANDFTIEEIKRLDAGAWYKPEFAGEKVVAFQEMIDLVRGKAGLYILS